MAVISYYLLFFFLLVSSSCIHYSEGSVVSDDSGYKTGNLAIHVEESSQSPSYLAIRFLNLGAQTEIVAVDVAQVGSPNWNFMNRKKHGIWETNSVPNGPLQFRVVVTAGLEGKWYWASKVMPEDWRNGEIYDTGLHITDTSILMEDTTGEL